MCALWGVRILDISQRFKALMQNLVDGNRELMLGADI